MAALCDLKVFFDSRSEPNREWEVADNLGFPHAYLPGFSIRHTRRRRDGIPNDRRYWQVRYGIVPALVRFRPEVVISIEFGPRSLQAALYTGLFNIPLILWSEGTPHTEGWQSALRRLIRRTLVKRARGFWTNGVESSELLVSYGAKAAALQDGMIGVNTTRLGASVRRHLSERETIRAELGLSGIVFLFSGQLVPRKGVRELLSALLPLSERAHEFSVAFLGDGIQRQLIEQWSAIHPRFRIVGLGFRQPHEVPRIYAASDVFVMPTLDDNWSLVALEAAIAGLPQIFSRFNGATADLLRKYAAGVVVDPLDAEQFLRAINEFLDRKAERVADHVTASLIDYYGPEACAARALKSIAEARCNPQPMRRTAERGVGH